MPPKTGQYEPEKHSMQGWGAIFADWTEPRTKEDAAIMAQLAAADRMLECMTKLDDIMHRLRRMERFMHLFVPGYREAQQQGTDEQDLAMLKQIAGIKAN